MFRGSPINLDSRHMKIKARKPPIAMIDKRPTIAIARERDETCASSLKFYIPDMCIYPWMGIYVPIGKLGFTACFGSGHKGNLSRTSITPLVKLAWPR